MKYEKIELTPHYPFKIFLFHTKSPDRLITPHWHESAELLFCRSGELKLIFPRKEFLLKKKEVIFINSNQIHSSSSPIPGECLAIQFPLAFLETVTEDCYNKKFLFNLTPSNGNPKILPLLDYISENYSSKDMAIRLFVQAKILELFSELIGNQVIAITEVEKTKSLKYLEIIGKINLYIHEHYSTELSIVTVADQFGYNPSYFSRFYKKMMGITYTEYLNSVRLEAAYKELRETDKTILEIAIHHGFTNPKTFYNVFLKQFGMSPQKYRQMYF